MDYNTLFRPIAESFAEHRPDGGTPFEVTCTETGRRLYVHVYLAWHVNDIRGVPSVTCSAHPPCYVGNCTLCKVKGVRRLNRIIVPGAVCYLPPTDALRKEYGQEFKNDQDLRALASSVRPLKRQKAEVAASAGRIARRQSNKADEAFYNVPVFQELLPYFDVTKCTIYDLAHNIANAIKLYFGCVCNDGGGGHAKFTDQVRDEEMVIRGRFSYLKR